MIEFITLKLFTDVRVFIYRQNGTLQVYSADEDSNPQSGYSSDKSPGQEYKKRFGFKTAATASRLAARISPKSVRKRSKYKPVLCKVSLEFEAGVYHFSYR